MSVGTSIYSPIFDGLDEKIEEILDILLQ